MPTALQQLKALIASGDFHHATYRCIGSLWEGLWFYRQSPNSFRGFEEAGCVLSGDPDMDAAHEVVKGFGISVGSYGGG